MRGQCEEWYFSKVIFLAAVAVIVAPRSNGFVVPQQSTWRPSSSVQLLHTAATRTIALTASATLIEEDLLQVSTLEIKDRLVQLLADMMGTPEDFQLVQSYVNTLERRYVPAMTLDFLNLAMGGDWQLLFSTNLAKWSKTPSLRVRDLMQRIDPQGLQGGIINSCTWEWTEEDRDDGNAALLSGTFSTKCLYKITQGARMAMDLEDHLLQPAKGSGLPQNVPKLVSLLHRTMPKELFDPSEHAMDITYLDGSLRIVRLTGPRLEGVRDIFIRRGNLDSNSTISSSGAIPSTIPQDQQGSLE